MLEMGFTEISLGFTEKRGYFTGKNAFFRNSNPFLRESGKRHFSKRFYMLKTYRTAPIFGAALSEMP